MPSDGDNEAIRREIEVWQGNRSKMQHRRKLNAQFTDECNVAAERGMSSRTCRLITGPGRKPPPRTSCPVRSIDKSCREHSRPMFSKIDRPPYLGGSGMAGFSARRAIPSSPQVGVFEVVIVFQRMRDFANQPGSRLSLTTTHHGIQPQHDLSGNAQQGPQILYVGASG